MQPVLVVKAAPNYFDAEIASSTARTGAAGLAAIVGESMLNDFRTFLSSQLPSVRDVISTLAPHHVLYLRSVYALEILRGSLLRVVYQV